MVEGLEIGQLAHLSAISFDHLKAEWVCMVYDNRYEVYKESHMTKRWRYLRTDSEFGIVGLVLRITRWKENGKMAVRLLIGEERWWCEWDCCYPLLVSSLTTENNTQLPEPEEE